jgi:hypothetical protein
LGGLHGAAFIDCFAADLGLNRIELGDAFEHRGGGRLLEPCAPAIYEIAAAGSVR